MSKQRRGGVLRWLAIIFLAIFSVLANGTCSAEAGSGKLATCNYDPPPQPSSAYDGAVASVCNYDAATALVGEERSGTVPGGVGSFPHHARFIAPNSTALVRYDAEFAIRQGADPATIYVPDSHVIVRGGIGEMPAPGTVFSGSMGMTLEQAASGVPNGSLRVSTAGAIRSSGGTVQAIPEGVPINLRHVNVVEGGAASAFSPVQPNPVPKPFRWSKAK